MALQILELTCSADRLPAAFYPLLKALRPGLTQEPFGARILEGGQQGLKVLTAWDGRDRCLAAAPYSVFATSRGRALFATLEQCGRAEHCERIELDSGVTNEAAHRFYQRQHMNTIALHFTKALVEQK